MQGDYFERPAHERTFEHNPVIVVRHFRLYPCMETGLRRGGDNLGGTFDSWNGIIHPGFREIFERTISGLLLWIHTKLSMIEEFVIIRMRTTGSLNLPGRGPYRKPHPLAFAA